MDYDMNALMAWLGPAADELTPEQIERVAAADRGIQRRYPDGDGDVVERQTALSATVQYLLGETDAAEASRELSIARYKQTVGFVTAVQVAVMMVGDGTPKAVAARECGIDRMSLLKALGERG